MLKRHIQFSVFISPAPPKRDISDCCLAACQLSTRYALIISPFC
nr:MAG TPA: hypothetical protein [Caudoviricetes sp.]